MAAVTRSALTPWRPPLVFGADTRLLVLLVATQAVIRGTDYLLGEGGQANTVLSGAEQALSLTVWGGIFVAGGALVFLGLAAAATRWPQTLRRLSGATVIAGHGVVACAYVGMAAGIGVTVLTRAESVTDVFDGIRTPTGFLVAASVHALLAIRSRWALGARRA